MIRELKMNKKDWEKVNTSRFTLQQRDDHDIINVEFNTIADIALVNVHLKNLEKHSVNKIFQYVPLNLLTRFKGFEKAAHIIRNDSNNTVNTKIRPGTNDFYLLVRKKGDQTPWAGIQQTYTPIDMKAKFEVGKLTTEDQKIEDKYYSDWNIKLNNKFNRVEKDTENRYLKRNEKSRWNDEEDDKENIREILEQMEMNDMTEEPSANSTLNDSQVSHHKRGRSIDNNINEKNSKINKEDIKSNSEQMNQNE